MEQNLKGWARRHPKQMQRGVLVLCALGLLLIAGLDHITVLARPELRRTYQESVLSPLAIPLTTTASSMLTSTFTSPLTVPLPISLTVPLTTAVPAPITDVVTTPLTATLPVTDSGLVTPVDTMTNTAIDAVTDTVTDTASNALTVPAPTVATAELLNRGQTSLLLVGAVLGGILVLIAVVLGRQR